MLLRPKNPTTRFFEKFGRTMTVESPAGTFTCKAFLQPLRYKNKMYLSGTLTEIGYDTLRKFVLICPTEANITAVDGVTTLLKFGGDSFCVDHCEKFGFGSKKTQQAVKQLDTVYDEIKRDKKALTAYEKHLHEVYQIALHEKED